MTIRKVIYLGVILLFIGWGAFELYDYRFWFLTNKGAYELYQRNYDEAIPRLTSLAAKHGKHQKRANMLLAETLAQTGRTDEARMILQKFPDSSWHDYMMGMLGINVSSAQAVSSFQSAIARIDDRQLSPERQKIARYSVALLDSNPLIGDMLEDCKELLELDIPAWMQLDKEYVTLLCGVLHYKSGEYSKASKNFASLDVEVLKNEELCLDMAISVIRDLKFDKVGYYLDGSTTAATVGNWRKLREQLGEQLADYSRKDGIDLHDVYVTDQEKRKLSLGIELTDFVLNSLEKNDIAKEPSNPVLMPEWIGLLARMGRVREAWQLCKQCADNPYSAIVRLMMASLDGKDVVADLSSLFLDNGTTVIQNIEFDEVPDDWTNLSGDQSVEWQTETELNLSSSSEYSFYCVAKPYIMSWRGIKLDIEIQNVATGHVMHDSLYYSVPYYAVKQVTNYLPSGDYRLKLKFRQTDENEWLRLKELLIVKKGK